MRYRDSTIVRTEGTMSETMANPTHPACKEESGAILIVERHQDGWRSVKVFIRQHCRQVGGIV